MPHMRYAVAFPLTLMNQNTLLYPFGSESTAITHQIYHHML